MRTDSSEETSIEKYNNEINQDLRNFKGDEDESGSQIGRMFNWPNWIFVEFLTFFQVYVSH